MAALDFTFTNNSSLPAGDHWAIPMSLKRYGASGKPARVDSGLKDGITSDQVYSKLKALTTPPVSGLPGPGGTNGAPLPAVVPGDFKQYGSGPKPGTSFARVSAKVAKLEPTLEPTKLVYS